ncbi:uncharacterized protein J3D65DRAFT_674975 [Phyllosticta citribraziliensis]|uniref:Nucleolar protein 12 n=1 Tax=Phyllosticta citribraziliensis TaxID=989973 RepID=A0ABR1LZY5_9PEZI
MAKDKSKKNAAVSQKDARALKLVADTKSIDPGLASLFAKPVGPAKPLPKEVYQELKRKEEEEAKDESDDAEEVDDEDLSSIDEELPDDDDDDENEDSDDDVSDKKQKPSEEDSEEVEIPVHESLTNGQDKPERKRKRKAEDDDLEGQYMRKLAKEEAKETAKRESERSKKRLKKEDGQAAEKSDDSDEDDGSSEEGDEDSEMEDASDASEADADSDAEVPAHESKSSTKPTGENAELDKAARTVFVGNVSTAAIKDKSAQKIFTKHMSSFLSELPKEKPAHKLESHRFRSTPFTASLPKKAAYVTKDIMDATAHSTNAYVVYSTLLAAREAIRRLNGTVVLERHIRVDSVAHPAKADHKRCVFVGNLGFVDDESGIQQAEAERFKKAPPKKKEPSDVEEGLWREFGKCGTVESVRVVRDPKTRVGKGFAYVQFTDENGVEAALLFNDKKFPPMLPRKLRVTRAKPFKRNQQRQQATGASTRPAVGGGSSRIYNPKLSAEEKSLQGRAAKLLGKAGAAKLKKPDFGTGANAVEMKDGKAGGKPAAATTGPGGFKAPEAFVFEGYRASSKGGKSGLKLGGAKKGASGKKGGKPASRSSKRGTAWKKSGGKK